MQLLQKLRDSSNLGLLTQEISQVESEARNLSRKLLDFLVQSRGTTILYSYTGLGYVPASLMYWFSLTFQSGKYPVLAEAEEASIYLAPYRDDFSLVIFSTGEYSKLITAIQVARMLEIEYFAIAPEPPAENLKQLARHYDVITIPYQDQVKTVLFTVITAFLALSELHKGALSSRGQRLFSHGAEGFACVFQSLVEKYVSTIESATRCSSLIVTSSRFLEAPAILLSYALRSSGLNVHYSPLEGIPSSTETPILGVFLTTEERIRREFKTTKKASLLELLLNVDPLEAPVYVSLLAYAIIRSSVL